MRQCGELVLRSQLESMVDVLDQHLFLEGPRVEAERARQRAAFSSAPTRPRVPRRALLRRRAGRARGGAGRPTSPRRRARGRSARRATSACTASSRRTSTSTAAGRPTRGRTAPWPRPPATRTASSSSAPPTRGSTATPSRRPPRPSRPRSARSRSIGRSSTRSPGGRRPISSPPSSLTGASTRSSSRRSGSSTCAGGAGGGARRIVPLLASFAHECLVRGGSPASAPEVEAVLDAVRRRDGDRPAPLLRRGGRGSRPRRPPLRRPVAGRPGGAARGPGRRPRAASSRSSNDAEGFFAEALRQEDRNRICGLSPIYALLRLLARRPAPGRLLQLRPVARPGRHGHLRQRELRRGRLGRMTATASDAGGVPGHESLGSLPDRPRWRVATRGRRGHPPGRPPEPLREPAGGRRDAPSPGGPAARPGRGRRRAVRRGPRGARARAGNRGAHLSDGSQEPLDTGTLVLDRRGVPYCRVKDGRFRARSRSRPGSSSPSRVEADPGSGEPVLVLGGRRLALRRAE